MNIRNLSRTLALAVSVVLVGMFAFSGSAFAKYRPGCDEPPCGGPGEETAAQNLSVPTIMVGTPPGNLTCGTDDAPSALVPPPGLADPDPLYYEVPNQSDVYWWVQKVHTWQAPCFYAGQAEVYGAWGDNLAGDAKLKVGSPIRVEIVLDNATDFSADLDSTLPATLQGYTVIKLEPDKLDRESRYGHPAVNDGEGGWAAVPVDFPQLTTVDTQGWLVHDSQITFSVLNMDTGVYAVPLGTNPTAEINATGKVVYGYNLRVGEPGAYRIQFTTSPPVKFTGVDDGVLMDSNNAYIDITVVTGGGGGKGKPDK